MIYLSFRLWMLNCNVFANTIVILLFAMNWRRLLNQILDTKRIFGLDFGGEICLILMIVDANPLLRGSEFGV